MPAAWLRLRAHGLLPVLGAVVVLATVTGIAAVGTIGGPQPLDGAPVSRIASVQLVDDDAGTALFSAHQMPPGELRRNCILVRYQSSGSAGPVYLRADSVAGGLTPFLEVTVERGAGGTMGDCDGFQGVTVFQGPLPDLAVPVDSAGPTGAGVDTGWRPEAGEASSFRFTVTLAPDADAAAQAQRGDATFVWSVTATDTEPAPPTTTSPPSPPSSPTPSNPPRQNTDSTPSVSETAEPTPDTPVAPTQSPAATPGGTTPQAPEPSNGPVPPEPTSSSPAPPGGPGEPLDGDDNGLSRAEGPGAKRGFARLVDDLAVLAEGVARRSGFSIFPLLLALAFLFVQSRLDGRDPKLALAPVFPQPHLLFPSSRQGGNSRTGGTRPNHPSPPARRRGST